MVDELFGTGVRPTDMMTLMMAPSGTCAAVAVSLPQWSESGGLALDHMCICHRLSASGLDLEFFHLTALRLTIGGCR